jgi:hypothetical protein
MNDKPKSKWYWRWLRWGLLSLAVLITLAAVLVAEEDWRGKRAWENYKREAEARGEHLDWPADATNTVPDEQNFVKAPIFGGFFANTGDGSAQTLGANSTNTHDPLKFSRDRNDGGPMETNGGWDKAGLVDLKLWQDYYRNPKTNHTSAVLAASISNAFRQAHIVSLGPTNNPAPDIKFPIAPQPQTPAADVLLALSIHDQPIEELRAASRRPYSNIGMTNANDPAVASRVLKYLAAMKRSTQLLELRAVAELADHQAAKGLDDVELLLRLDDKLRQEPTLIAHLVSVAITAIQMQPIYEGLAQHGWNDAQLAELESALAAKDFLADYQKAMRGERTYAIESMESERITREVKYEVEDDSGEYKIMTDRLRWTPTAFFYQTELNFARFADQYALPLVDLERRTVSPAALRRAEAAVQGELKHHNPYKIMAGLSFSAVAPAVEKFAAAQSQTDLALVACALERYRLAHGAYPDTLGALTPQFIEKLPHDIINGQPLHYRRTADGLFVLYSLGWNETDHGGQIALNKNGGIDRKNSDWVWRYPAEEK